MYVYYGFLNCDKFSILELEKLNKESFTSVHRQWEMIQDGEINRYAWIVFPVDKFEDVKVKIRGGLAAQWMQIDVGDPCVALRSPYKFFDKSIVFIT